MKGACELFSLNISNNELEHLAVNIGADVPFFINGSIQLGEGIGEKLTPLKRKVNGKLDIFSNFQKYIQVSLEK